MTQLNKALKVSFDALTHFGAQDAQMRACETFKLPQPAPGVLPKSSSRLAMDACTTEMYPYAQNGAVMAEGLSFLGYPYLAELTQRAEYRRAAEIIAQEMTRKWIKLQAIGDEDKTNKLQAIDAELTRLNAQFIFRKAMEHDGFFGRGQIYIDTGSTDSLDELKTELVAINTKVPKGCVKRLVIVEPMWTYPSQFNSTNPLADDFYSPTRWFVMGRELHASRLMTLITRPVPDILKPAYAFGGLSLSQMCKPYVDNWLRTRQSVSDLIHSFSTMVLKTNLGAVLSGGGGEDMVNRARLFNQARDNRGLMMLDKDTEDFSNVNTPLGGLDHLQAQAFEQLAAVTGIPLVVFAGITPSGLNASSAGEIQAWQAHIHARQEAHLRPGLQRLLALVQLSLFGEVDDGISFQFEPLTSVDEAQTATIRKAELDADAVAINAGIIDANEARKRLAAQPDSPYAALDLSKQIAQPQAQPKH